VDKLGAVGNFAVETEEELWDRIQDATGVELVADINSGL
jgi:hypothetical protein